MANANWNTCHNKIKRKLDGWSGRHLTIIGKANIIKSQIQPLVSFVGKVLDMPDCIDKNFRTVTYKFLWGKSDQ
jgi:hypothetical protein